MMCVMVIIWLNWVGNVCVSFCWIVCFVDEGELGDVICIVLGLVCMIGFGYFFILFVVSEGMIVDFGGFLGFKVYDMECMIVMIGVGIFLG